MDVVAHGVRLVLDEPGHAAHPVAPAMGALAVEVPQIQYIDRGSSVLGHGVGGTLLCAAAQRDFLKSRPQQNEATCKSTLIQAIGRHGDAHGAFTLLHSCTGWAKILYSCRIVLLALQSDALAQVDSDIKGALCRLAGSPLSDDDWRLASLGISAGGVGARSAREHAPAACVASLSATAALSTRIWHVFGEVDKFKHSLYAHQDQSCIEDVAAPQRVKHKTLFFVHKFKI